jgi:hypothetical protein
MGLHPKWPGGGARPQSASSFVPCELARGSLPEGKPLLKNMYDTHETLSSLLRSFTCGIFCDIFAKNYTLESRGQRISRFELFRSLKLSSRRAVRPAR